MIFHFSKNSLNTTPTAPASLLKFDGGQVLGLHHRFELADVVGVSGNKFDCVHTALGSRRTSWGLNEYSSQRLQNIVERSETHSLKASYAEMGSTFEIFEQDEYAEDDE